MDVLALLALPVPAWVPCTALLHMLLVEDRQIYLFYLSAKNMITKVAMMAELDDKAAEYEDIMDFRNSTLADDRACIAAAVRKAMWFMDSDGDKCYHGQPVLIGFFHMSALLVVIVFVAVTFSLLLQNGAQDFSSPQYMVFTWQLEHMPAYRTLAHCLLGYTGIVFLVAVILSTGIFPGFRLRVGPLSMLESAGSDMLLLIYSAYSHFAPHDPAFDWQSETFLQTRWRRSFKSLLTQSNDSFANDIAEAILKAEENDVRLLDGIAVDSRSAKDLMEQVRRSSTLADPLLAQES